MEYDAQRRCFTAAALARLQQMISAGNGSQPNKGDRYADCSRVNGSQAEQAAYHAYVAAMGKAPENVAALREWYAASS